MSQNSLVQVFYAIMNDVDDDLKDFKPLIMISDILKVRRSYIATFVTLQVLFLNVFDFLALWSTVAFGIVYPGYMTSTNLQTQDKRVILKWKIYWIIFVFTTLFDSFFFFILYFIPSYYTLKPLFYLWLFYPRSEGTLKIYDYVISPTRKLIKNLKQQSNSEEKQK